MTKDDTWVGTDYSLYSLFPGQGASLKLCETGGVERSEEVQDICKRHFEALC